jgi:hypothetical protein
VLRLPITKSWICSSAAERVYLVCALLTLTLIGTLIGSKTAMALSGNSSLAVSAAAASVIRILLFPGVLGTALLTTAMWYFWLNFDQSSWIKKAAWFLPLYVVLGVGPALYYFFVYRRRVD